MTDHNVKVICRHCKARRISRPRGLCWTCYHVPGVREQYLPGSANPATARYVTHLRRSAEQQESIRQAERPVGWPDYVAEMHKACTDLGDPAAERAARAAIDAKLKEELNESTPEENEE